MIELIELKELARQQKCVFVPLKPLGKLVMKNGYFYPMENGSLLNPLDAFNLIACCDPARGDLISMFYRTLMVAKEFKGMGYDIVARLNSGAPRVIQVDGKNGDFFILGDISKKEGLYYPLLTALLADDEWDFDGLWSTYNFKRPTMPKFSVSKTGSRAIYTDCYDPDGYTLDDYKLTYIPVQDSDGNWDRIGRWERKEPTPVDRPDNVWDDGVKDF